MSECLNWYNKADRRYTIGLLLIAGDILEARTEECRNDAESCELRYTRGCPWSFWGEIGGFIDSVINTLTPAEIEHLEALERNMSRLDIHSPKAEPMKTAVLLDLMGVSYGDILELNKGE